MEFGLHKIWFFYTDEWYTTNDKLANCVGTFNTLEEAKHKQKEMDIRSLRNMHSDDYVRDLTGFMESGNCKKSTRKLLHYAKAIGWEDFITEERSEFNEEPYYKLAIPKDATDEQLWEIIIITGAYFHKIIEYKEVTKYAYVKLNYNFWGTKGFKYFKEAGLIEDRAPYINGKKIRGKYLIEKALNNRKSATFNTVDKAWSQGIAVTLQGISMFPANTFLARAYVEELSNMPILLMNFLKNCKTLKLEGELVNDKNHKKVLAKLKKLKSKIQLEKGHHFFRLVIPEPAEVDEQEMKSLIELLSIKPFTVYEIQKAINGEDIKVYYPNHGIF